MTKQVWQALHKAAMLETDPVELRKKIDVANGAIHERVGDLANDHNRSWVEELQETMDALHDFQALQHRNNELPADTPVTAPLLQQGVV
jgi:hypothetical protein